MSGSWSGDQSAWPAHLRDDAPSQRCNRCGRYTWSTSEFNPDYAVFVQSTSVNRMLRGPGMKYLYLHKGIS